MKWKLRGVHRRFRSAFALTIRSLALAMRSSPGVGASIVVCTVVSAGLPVAIAYVGKLIIDAVVAKDSHAALRWAAAELALVGGQALVSRLVNTLRTLLGARLGILVNSLILRKALGLELSQFEDSEYYDKLTRALREASTRPLAMLSDALLFGQNTLMLSAYAFMLFAFSPWAVLAMIAASLPATWAEATFSRKMFQLQNWRSPGRRRLTYLEHVLTNDALAKETKVLGLGPALLDRYESMGEKFFREDRTLLVRRSAWSYLLSLLSLAAFYGAYFWMVMRAALGLITVGTMSFYALAFRQGQQAFQACLNSLSSIYEHNLYMDNLFRFFDLPEAVSNRRPDRPAPVGGAIEFERVSFRYPGREEWALKDVSLRVEEGESIAIVGFNGAGKSTLIKLLCGLYEPSEGRILVGGRDLRDGDRLEWWKRLSVVFQDFSRYQFPLGENIGMGDLPALNDEAQVERAARNGGADELAKSLPAGLGTQLGKMFQGGIDLSGGQWQKVGLARAFMREDAPIVILDEPTAALDPEAEDSTVKRFRELTQEKTSFVISHRFPTARLADRILVMEQGQIVERGTHEELLGAGGLYARLFALQASGYR